MPELTTRLVAMMSDRIREGTRIEQQRDRLVSLGKLSAGLAHELNNPASAAKRASDQMRNTLARLRNANSELWRCPLEDSDRAKIEEVEASLLQSEPLPLDGLALSDLEETLESIVRSYGYADPWELSAGLAKANMPPDDTQLFTESARYWHGSGCADANRRFCRIVGSSKDNRELYSPDIESGSDNQGIYPHGPGASSEC